MVLFWNLDFYVFSMGEEENQIMGFIDVKEKVIKTLGEFLEGIYKQSCYKSYNRKDVCCD